MKKNLLLLFLVLFTQQLFSTNIKTDSLSRGTDNKLPLPTLFELIKRYEIVSSDKAMVYCQQAIESSLQKKDKPGEALATFYLGKILRKTDNYAQALKKQQHAETLFQQCANDSMIAESRLEIGLNYFKTANQEKAIHYFNKSLEFFKQRQDSTGISIAYYNLGRSHRKSGNLDTALTFSLSSLEYAPQNNHNALNTISIIHGMLGNLPEALAYQQRCLNIRTTLDLPDKILYSLNNLGIISRLMGNPEQSLSYYQRSIAVAEKIGKKSGLNKVLNNIGVIYTDELNQPKKALEYYQKSLKISRKLDDKFAIANTLTNIGSIQSELEQYASALVNIQSGITIAEKINALELLQNGYLTLSQHHQRLKNHQQSLENFKQYSTFRDSIINQKTQNKIAELQVKYENEQLKSKNELYQARLRRKNLFRIHIYLALALVLILALALLFLYLNKIRINHRLNQEISKRSNIEASLATRVKDQTKTLSEQLTISEKERNSAAILLDDLNNTTQNLRLEISERTRQEKIQQILYQISLATHITSSLGEFFHIIQEKLGTILDTQNFFIAFYNKETDTVSIPYFKDEKDQLDTFPAGKSCTAYVIRNKKPLLAKAEHLQELARAGKIDLIGTLAKVWLGAPISIDNDCIGALVIQNYHDENAYNERDLELFEFIANQIYLFIDHKRAEQKLLESQERFKKLSNLTFEGILIHTNGVVSDMNESLERMLGYSTKKLIGKNFIQLCIPSEYHQSVKENITKKWATPYELMIKRKDGTLLPVEVEARDVIDDGISYRVTAIRDITERKRTEQAKKESEEKFRILAETSPMAIMLYQNDKWIYVNPAAEQLCGYTLAELQTMNFWTFVAPEYQESIKQNGKARQAGKQPGRNYEFKIISKMGQGKWVSLNGNTIKLAGIDTGFISVSEITEQKEAQKKLAFQSLLLNQIKDNVTATDLKGQITYVNQAESDTFGKPAKSLHGQHVEQYGADPDRGATQQEIIDTTLAKGEWRGEVVNFTEDGRNIIFESRTQLIYNDCGEPIGMLGISTDITERKIAETALRQSEERFRTIYENAPALIDAFDDNGRCVLWNKQCRTLFGWTMDELNAQDNILPTFYPDPKELKEVLDSILEPAGDFKEWHPVTKDGKTLTTLWANFRHPDGSVIGLGYDITEQKRAETEKAKLEKQLHRSQKLETIGTLAGGIAHDFNNILTPIIGYTDMVLLDQPPTSQIAEDLEQVLIGAHRAKELVQQILTFSRQIEHERKPLKLHLIVKEALQLLRPSIPTTIKIEQRIDTSCEMVLADPSQMHQVIVNLCTNSYQAMEKNGGTLTIEMKQVAVDALMAKTHPNLQINEYIQLTVRDTGIGIDTPTMDHIFEPFFTTKSVGKGTGLGLSVTYGIVRSHHGDILVHSERGKGSAFHVYLPVTKNEDKTNTHKTVSIQGGNESILIVDDEVAITTLLKKMLERLGYHVTVQNSSIDALKIFRKQAATFDLVLSDLTMPIMNGLDMAKKFHKVRAEVPIIVITGYGESLSDEVLKEAGIEKIIGKPIETKSIAAEIRQTLDK